MKKKRLNRDSSHFQTGRTGAKDWRYPLRKEGISIRFGGASDHLFVGISRRSCRARSTLSSIDSIFLNQGMNPFKKKQLMEESFPEEGW